jgi:hypothetical protein
MILDCAGRQSAERRRSAGGDLSSALGRLKECGITHPGGFIFLPDPRLA